MGVVRAMVAFGDWHTISIAASEGNLRFPSGSLPNLNPRGRAAGKVGIIGLGTTAIWAAEAGARDVPLGAAIVASVGVTV